MNSPEMFLRYWMEACPVVAGYLHGVVRDRTMAEDLLQEVSIVLMRRFAEFDESRPFVAWAIGTAKQRVLGMHRDEQRSLLTFSTEIMDQIAGTYAAMAPELTARDTALHQCLGHLEGRARQTVELRYFEDFKPREIAVRLSMTPGAVRVMLNRVRTILRECVQRTMEEGAV